MTERRLRNSPPGIPRFPRCEAMYPPPENPPRTRFLTLDNVLFDIVDASVTPSVIMTKAIFYARRAAQQLLRVEPPPSPAPFSAVTVQPSPSIPVALCGAPHQLQNVTSEPLEMALTYCYFHTSAEYRSMSPANLTFWDDQFVRISPSQLCELASAAYYLDIRDLVDLTCRAIADIISGKNAEQIHTTFHIENDLVQSLILCQDLDAPSAPHIQPSQQQNESKSFPPIFYVEEGADADNRDLPKEMIDSLDRPQLGRNATEQVESWMIGDSTPEKNIRKRRKKRKNKLLTNLSEKPHPNSASSYSQCPNLSCSSQPQDFAAMESSPPPSLVLAPNVKGHESPASLERNDDCLYKDSNCNMHIQDSTSREPGPVPSNEEVVFVSMITRDHCNASNLQEALGEESATVQQMKFVDESIAANVLPSVLDSELEQQRRSDDGQENSVWSITSDDSSAAHLEEQQNHTMDDQSPPTLQIRSRIKELHQQNDAQSSGILAPVHCLTNSASKRGALESQDSQYTQGSGDVAPDRVMIESGNNRGTVEKKPVASYEGSNYICSLGQVDREVEEVQSRRGDRMFSTGPSKMSRKNRRETENGQGHFQCLRGRHPREGREQGIALTKELIGVRREAQLVERERLYRQRANAIEKQIADLHSEREKVGDKLSLVKIQLM